VLAKHDSTPKPLDDTYYLDNFNYLCEFVEQRYCHLLDEEEQWFIDTYKNLSANAQQVYVRVASRTAPCIRVSKLRYAEIKDIPDGI